MIGASDPQLQLIFSREEAPAEKTCVRAVDPSPIVSAAIPTMFKALLRIMVRAANVPVATGNK